MWTLRLSDADRERLGVPTEWIPLDVFGVTNREAVELVRIGFATPFLWRQALPSQVDEAGLRRVDYAAWTGAVWLALRRAGIPTDIQTLEFDMERWQLDPGDESGEEPDPGKEPPTGDGPPPTPDGT